MAPHTCDERSCQAGPRTSISPAYFALTWNYVRVLPCLTACGDAYFHRCAERATERSGPCLTLGRFVCVFTVSAVNGRNTSRCGENV